MKSTYIVYATIIIALLFAFLISIESDQRAFMLRDCISKTKPNGDGLTIDREDVDLCVRAYDKRTSRSYELQKAIKRPQVDSKMQEL